MKNKTNKQANNTQSRSLALGLPKHMWSRPHMYRTLVQFLLNWSCLLSMACHLKKKKVLPLTTILPKCDQVVKRARYYREKMVKSCFWALKTHRRNQLTHPFSKVQVHNFCFPFTIPRLLQQWFCFPVQLVLINIKTLFSSCWTYLWEIIWFGSQCEPCASQVDLATLYIL